MLLFPKPHKAPWTSQKHMNLKHQARISKGSPSW